MQDNATNCERRHGDQPTGSSTAVPLPSCFRRESLKKYTDYNVCAQRFTKSQEEQPMPYVRQKNCREARWPREQLPGQPQNAIEKWWAYNTHTNRQITRTLSQVPNRPRRPFVQRYGKACQRKLQRLA